MSRSFILNLTQSTNSMYHCPYLKVGPPQQVQQGNNLPPEIFYNLVAMCVTNGMVGILTTTANILTITSILKNRLLRNNRFMLLLVSMSLTDLFVGVLLQPLWIVETVFEIGEPLGQVGCHLRLFVRLLGKLCIGASLGHVTLISIERYFAIRLAARYRSITSFRKTLTAILCVWTFFILYAVLPVTLRFLPDPLLGWSVIIGLNVFITATCYLGAFCKKRSSTAAINSISPDSVATQRRIKKDKKVAKIMIVTFAVLALFYLPEMILTVFHLATINKKKLNFLRIGLKWTQTVMNTNSLVNPFFYCWQFKEIRKGVLKLIGCSKVLYHSVEVLPSQFAEKYINAVSPCFQNLKEKQNVAISSHKT